MEKQFKLFNWSEAKKVRTPEVWSWMFANYYKTVSEDEFFRAIDKFRGVRKSKRISPSAIKKEYKRLKKNYGFFM